MPHLLVFAAGAVSIYFAFRWVRREYDPVDASLRRADRRIRRPSQDRIVPLVLDDATGCYRPAE